MSGTSDETQTPELSSVEVVKAQIKVLKNAQSNYSDAIKLIRVAQSDALKDAKDKITPYITDLKEAEENGNKSIEQIKSVINYLDGEIKAEKPAKSDDKSKLLSNGDESKIKWNLVLLQWGIIFLVLIVFWRKFIG